ncbi:MAG: PQQ-dependent sugar dehydrogenase, partial [Planctomycetota bacterium]
MLKKRRARQTFSSFYQTLEERNLLATIDIVAAGVTNQESMSLLLNGSVIQTFDNIGGNAYAGAFQTYSVSTAGTVSANDVRIRFNNDLYDPANGIDRNLRIDALIIDSVRFETEAPEVFSTGTWKQEDGITPGFRESEFLHTDGYFQYAESASGTPVEVFARGDEGGEEFEVRIDGATVFSASVGTAFQSYTFNVNQEVSPESVQVFFTNDVYNPGQGIDRNLVVDFIRIDGTRFDSEAPSVFSTGTWKPEDGIQPGFRESETLHTNGYFQYGQSGNPGVISLQSSIVDVAESDQAADFVIQRTGGSDGIVTVDYATVAITATPGQDYESRSGTITFQNGETLKTISIPLIEDQAVEDDEQFSFTIDNVAGGASLLAPRTATATIDDNDSVVSEGDGLLGEYFDQRGFVDKFGQRIDPVVDFDWGSGAPLSGMGANTFSVRWTGQIEPLYSESYTFTTISDDGIRLWIDGQLIINEWNDHAPTAHTGTFTLSAGQLYDIRLEHYENSGGAVARLLWQSASQSQEVVPQSQLYAADPPIVIGDQLESQTLVAGLIQPTAIDFSPDGTLMYIAEQRGIIRVMDNGSLVSDPFLVFTDRVNGTRDRGLLDIAVHPDFENSPYIYMLYTYDPPQVNNYAAGTLQGPDGRGNRAARLTRVTADASAGNLSVVPGSEVVILGTNSTWDNFNAFVNSTSDFNEPPAGILPDGSNVNDFIATDSESHTIGSIEFGPDGSLYVSIGDGTSYNRVDPRTERVQDIDNLSGKVLRINPDDGGGFSDNPFYDGDRFSNRSRVWQSGLRNPFRMTVSQQSGQVYIGDVGWTQWEEINAADPGANFGWPWYEGASGSNARTGGYRDLPEAQAFYNSGQIATPSIYALNHAADGINAIVLGDIYDGNTYPAEFQGDLFFNDLGQGIVRNISFDSAGNISAIDTFSTGHQIVVQMVTAPDGNMYFVDLDDGSVGRWVFVEDGAATSAAAVSPQTPVGIQTSSGNATGQTVAVIDSGIDLTNAGLYQSLWVNSGEVPGDGIDNDGNGFIDDVHGFDFVGGVGQLTDQNGHGTFISGLIGGDSSNELQGIAAGADIMMLTALGADGTGRTQSIASAIRYAVDNRADVINISLQAEITAELQEAIAHAADNSVLIVVAAGNSSSPDAIGMAALSAEFDNVVSVGGLDAGGNLLVSTNRVGQSEAVQIDAPGVSFGLLPGGSYGTWTGTSVAAAHVSATAALALAANPELGAAQIRDLLLATSSIVASGSDSHGSLAIEDAIGLALKSSQFKVLDRGTRIDVYTSASDDYVVYSLGSSTVAIDGIRFELPARQTYRLYVNGRTGNDRIMISGTDLSEAGLIDNGFARIANADQVFVARDFDRVTMFGNAGNDSILIYDTAANDAVAINVDSTVLSQLETYRGAFGFEQSRVTSRSGDDRVE